MLYLFLFTCFSFCPCLFPYEGEAIPKKGEAYPCLKLMNEKRCGLQNAFVYLNSFDAAFMEDDRKVIFLIGNLSFRSS